MASLEVWLLGHDGLVLLSVVAKALFYNYCVQVSSFLSSGDAVDDHQWEVQALSARFHAGARSRCRVVEEGFHL
jgi:hypothetical protein